MSNVNVQPIQLFKQYFKPCEDDGKNELYYCIYCRDKKRICEIKKTSGYSSFKYHVENVHKEDYVSEMAKVFFQKFVSYYMSHNLIRLSQTLKEIYL